MFLQVMKAQVQVTNQPSFNSWPTKKKKNVSRSKLESINELSYSQLQKAFENLHREAVYAFKKLA